jgi:hypothetical protein
VCVCVRVCVYIKYLYIYIRARAHTHTHAYIFKKIAATRSTTGARLPKKKILDAADCWVFLFFNDAADCCVFLFFKRSNPSPFPLLNNKTPAKIYIHIENTNSRRLKNGRRNHRLCLRRVTNSRQNFSWATLERLVSTLLLTLYRSLRRVQKKKNPAKISAGENWFCRHYRRCAEDYPYCCFTAACFLLLFYLASTAHSSMNCAGSGKDYPYYR